MTTEELPQEHICPKCNKKKPITEFYIKVDKRTGYKWIRPCKECCKANKKKLADENKESYLETRRAAYKRKAENPEYRAKNAARTMRNAKADPEKKKAADKKYREEHLKDSIIHRLRQRFGIQQRRYFKGQKTCKIVFTEILGCNEEELLAYLGPKPCDDAQIDHVIPAKQAKTLEELIKLQHFTNLQWLTPSENAAKHHFKTDKGVLLCRHILGREWE